MKEVVLCISSFFLGYVYYHNLNNLVKRNRKHRFDDLMKRLEEIKPCNECLEKEKENKILECKLDEMILSEKDLEDIMEELDEDEDFIALPNTPLNTDEEGDDSSKDETGWLDIFYTNTNKNINTEKNA